MKRLHVHVAVNDLNESIRFYSSLFATRPSVVKDDYAKWMLEDPRVNFAISARGRKPGLDHLGIQTESDEELQEINARLNAADSPTLAQPDTACCYAKSNKAWTIDPQGIAWEAFHTLDTIPMFGDDVSGNTAACCVPTITQITSSINAKENAACCEPNSGCC